MTLPVAEMVAGRRVDRGDCRNPATLKRARYSSPSSGAGIPRDDHYRDTLRLLPRPRAAGEERGRESPL